MLSIEEKEKKRQNQIRVNQYKIELTKKATRHELILKNELKKLGVKFKFQKVVFNKDKLFILDFYLQTSTGRWAIELDGESHRNPKSYHYDKKRSQWLKEFRSINVLRFDNDDIDLNLSYVLQKILKLKPHVNNLVINNTNKQKKDFKFTQC